MKEVLSLNFFLYKIQKQIIENVLKTNIINMGVG